jgi:ATP-dependent Lhr-like helicase
MSPTTPFHPAVARWFSQTFAAPTPAQAEAWPAIQAGRHVLIAAPTGSGKTLAAFLAAIDSLVRQGLDGCLEDQTQVVYVSPLKALSNDIERNLAAPLAGIRAELRTQGLPDVEIRTWVRTGDTPANERSRMSRRPPHIVVTTPESLYVLLGSDSGRAMLETTRTVIVDEIHAIAPNKRGSHLSLSLERLAALCPQPVLRRARRRRSRSRRSPISSSGPRLRRARSSISGTGASAIWQSRCLRLRSKPSCRPRSGARSTIASPNWSAAIARL